MFKFIKINFEFVYKKIMIIINKLFFIKMKSTVKPEQCEHHNLKSDDVRNIIYNEQT